MQWLIPRIFPGETLRKGRNAMLKTKRKTYQDFVDAQCEGKPHEMWAAIRDVCADYDGKSPFPHEIVFIFREIARDLAHGKTPETILGIVQCGKKSNERDTQIAVLYARAVEDGIVSDKTYANTIKKAYGNISSRTWSNWRKDYGQSKETDPSLFWPIYSNKERARILKFLLSESGKSYRQRKEK